MGSLMLALALAISHVMVPGLYGNLREGSAYASGATLQLVCGSDSATVTTDKHGSFRFSMKSPGKCHLTATYDGKTTSALDVVLYDQPVSCRLMLEQRDGELVLSRQ